MKVSTAKINSIFFIFCIPSRLIIMLFFYLSASNSMFVSGLVVIYTFSERIVGSKQSNSNLFILLFNLSLIDDLDRSVARQNFYCDFPFLSWF